MWARLGLNSRLRRPALTLATPVIVAGLIGTVVAVRDRESDTQFIARQQSLAPVQADQLTRLLASAPNPRPGLGNPRGTSATCSPQGIGELRNPWMCSVRYPRGVVVRYTVSIAPNGHVSAIDPRGDIVIRGCCVGPHPAQ
jgi:hypothetical protein